MEAKAIGMNGTRFNDAVLGSTDESVLVMEERIPVLVPGLTQVLTSKVHADRVVSESSLGSNKQECNVLLNEIHKDKVVAERSVGSKLEEFKVTEINCLTPLKSLSLYRLGKR